MGITGLSSFLKNQRSTYKLSVPVSWFKGCRIAIDTYLIGYAYMSTAIGSESKKILSSKNMEIDEKSLMKKWLQRFISTIFTFKEAGLKPVFVIDGKAPPEKAATRAKRNLTKQNVRDEINSLKDKLKDEELHLDLETRKKIVSIMSRDVRINQNQWDRLIEVIELFGIPVIKAKGEGEALCSTLVKQGKCTAVFTQDSDAGAYLAPIVITDIETASFNSEGVRLQQCTVIYYNRLFKMLGLKPEQFVHFCAMLKNDYIDNVPNFGPVKCFNLIKKYGLIENIPKEEFPDPNPELRKRTIDIFKEEGQIEEGGLEEYPIREDITTELNSKGILQHSYRLLRLLGVNSSKYEIQTENSFEDENPAELL